MKMEFLGYDSSVSSQIRDFDELHFYNIVKYVNNLSVDEFDIAEDLKNSQYNLFPDQQQKKYLDSKIGELKEKCPLLETGKQGLDYEWIYINRKEKGQDAFRFYFGVNPMNMYKLVEKLTEKFVEKGVTVSFKYQQEGKRKQADRIILYTNSIHIAKVEEAIYEVYNENKELFNGSERMLPWIYESKIPNVYFAPENINHSKSYGELFANALMDSKKIFYYLYQEDKVKDPKQLEMLKKIVLSTMFRNGLFLTKDNKRAYTAEQGITTFYFKEDNSLRNFLDDKSGKFYDVTYDSSLEGKRAFLNNFYTVKKVSPQKGATPRVLSRQERIAEIFNYLYPKQNNDIKKSTI